jgi:RHS repeat-associated protein
VTSTFSIDALGRRVRKFDSSGAASTVVFVYGQAGELLGEYDSAGKAVREYVWLGTTPIAVFTPDPASATNPPLTYFIHADHIDTPRIIVDKSNQLRWRWLAEPFGTTAPENNPAGLGVFTFNLRFPGQYFDQGTGLSQNWFRDYDAGLGRYTESDPLGLAGGSLSTFAYVGGNPVSYVDPTGLVQHKTGQWKQCANGCRIRIDWTLMDDGTVKRHLHWECKGKSGEFGENGEASHGQTSDSAPESIRECARKHGFAAKSILTVDACRPPSPAFSSPGSQQYFTRVTTAEAAVVVGTVAAAVCAAAEPCGVIATVGGGAAGPALQH